MNIAGTLQRHEHFQSNHIAARHVDVWLPPGYSESERYPVLYMSDGQNIFEPISSMGGVAWELDKAITRLVDAKKIPRVIVVGVWNSAMRWREYMPQSAYEAPAYEKHREAFIQKAGGPAVSDSYLKFLVTEVKPFIDSTYPTLRDQRHTVVMGSSMGGLIALYALSQYPDVFYGAGCLSTHWLAGFNELVDEMGMRLPDHQTHKLYFDFGTRGDQHDALYEPYQTRMDEHVRRAGYTAENWLTRKFEGADHNEAAWRDRVEIPLSFLLAR
jgi:predicted alpha/beta superfamily hydrolase